MRSALAACVRKGNCVPPQRAQYGAARDTVETRPVTERSRSSVLANRRSRWVWISRHFAASSVISSAIAAAHQGQWRSSRSSSNEQMSGRAGCPGKETKRPSYLHRRDRERERAHVDRYVYGDPDIYSKLGKVEPVLARTCLAHRIRWWLCP